MIDPEQKKLLREIVWAKCSSIENLEWCELCDSLGIRRIGKLTHICAPPELGEVRIPDPWGNYLSISEETARKILVLGL